MTGAIVAAALLAMPAGALTVDERFRLLQSETLRVETVFLRLARAAKPFCTARGPQLGLVLHQRTQYLPEVRGAAERLFGLDDAPAVLAVASDSAGARAGLEAGDAILAIDGVALPGPPDDGVHGDAGRKAGQMLDRAVARGPVTVTVRRGARAMSLHLTGEEACAGTISLEPSEALDAQAGQGRVVVTTAIVEFVRSDDELAFLIGHELGHIATGEVRGRDGENQADMAGLRFAKAAGFDPCAAPVVLARLAAARHQGWRIALDHPPTSQRIESLRAASGGTCTAQAG